MTDLVHKNSTRCRRAIACVLAALMVLSHSSGAIAQTVPDITAPFISPERVDSAPADLSQVFTVQAEDDLGLGDVSLHYRRAGENVFIRVLMEPVGDTGFFSVAIETDQKDLRAFEYYAQALDLNGNRTVSGFAFDPFVRTLTAPSSTSIASTAPAKPASNTNETIVAAKPPQSDQSTTSGGFNRNWIYIALGVLAVGAVASQAGGSDNGTGATGDDPTVPLTVIIRDPL